MGVYKDLFGDESTPISCDKLRYDLIMCIRGSRCYSELKETPRVCLNKYVGTEYLPDECAVLRYQMYECKRSLIDMRQRFRGRKHQVFPTDKKFYGKGFNTEGIDGEEDSK